MLEQTPGGFSTTNPDAEEEDEVLLLDEGCRGTGTGGGLDDMDVSTTCDDDDEEPSPPVLVVVIDFCVLVVVLVRTNTFRPLGLRSSRNSS